MRGERVSVLYRVSTDQQATSGLGLEAQRAAVATQVAREGWDVVHEECEDGVSGKTPLAERPGLTRAMAKIATGDAEILLVAKLDRLSRDPLSMLVIEKTIYKLNARIVSCAGEGTASDDPDQILMRRVMSAVAENEAAMISQRTRVALAAKKARGERLGRPPFGFEVHYDHITGQGSLVPARLFPELATCCIMLGYKGQDDKELLAYNPHGAMTQREIADHMNEYHGERTTWSHDKVGRISRRYSRAQRSEIVSTWKKMKGDSKDG